MERKEIAVVSAMVASLVSVLLFLNFTGQMTAGIGPSGSAFDIQAVIDALEGSPDYSEMDPYLECSRQSALLSEERVRLLAEEQPAIYGGIGAEVYSVFFACEGEPTGLLVLYSPDAGEVLKVFTISSAVW